MTIIAICSAILASSWALLAGYAGQFSFAHMAFAALGGYTSALPVADLGLLAPLGMLTRFLAAPSAGAAIGFCSLRRAGPYLAHVCRRDAFFVEAGMRFERRSLRAV